MYLINEVHMKNFSALLFLISFSALATEEYSCEWYLDLMDTEAAIMNENLSKFKELDDRPVQSKHLIERFQSKIDLWESDIKTATNYLIYLGTATEVCEDRSMEKLREVTGQRIKADNEEIKKFRQLIIAIKAVHTFTDEKLLEELSEMNLTQAEKDQFMCLRENKVNSSFPADFETQALSGKDLFSRNLRISQDAETAITKLGRSKLCWPHFDAILAYNSVLKEQLSKVTFAEDAWIKDGGLRRRRAFNDAKENFQKYLIFTEEHQKHYELRDYKDLDKNVKEWSVGKTKFRELIKESLGALEGKLQTDLKKQKKSYEKFRPVLEEIKMRDSEEL
jgi:hypothetical protein